MEIGMNERLRMILLSIAEYIGVLESYGYRDTAKLLAMAKLDLQIKLNQFTDEEMREFVLAVESSLARNDEAATPLRKAAGRK